MPDYAETSQQSLRYVEEIEYGTTPDSPSMKRFRFTGDSLTLASETFVSEEIDGDSQVKDERHTGRQVNGALNSYLFFSDVDDFMEAVFRGTWTTTSQVSAITISADAETDKISDSANGFGAFVDGDWVTVDGFSEEENNGTFLVTAASADSLTLNTSLTDEVAGDSVTVTRHPRLAMGTAKRSFTLEKYFSDIGRHRLYTGVVFNTLSMNFAPRAAATLAFGVIGKSMSLAASSLGTPAAVSSNKPMSGIDVSSVQIDGADVAKLASLSLEINKGGQAKPALGSAYPAFVSRGRTQVTGNASMYFDNDDMIAKYLAETEIKLYWALTDPAGNRYHFTMDRVKFNSETPPSGGIDDPLTQGLGYRALKHSSNGSLYVVKIAA